MGETAGLFPNNPYSSSPTLERAGRGSSHQQVKRRLNKPGRGFFNPWQSSEEEKLLETKPKATGWKLELSKLQVEVGGSEGHTWEELEGGVDSQNDSAWAGRICLVEVHCSRPSMGEKPLGHFLLSFQGFKKSLQDWSPETESVKPLPSNGVTRNEILFWRRTKAGKMRYPPPV